jgi:hypothetical protein
MLCRRRSRTSPGRSGPLLGWRDCDDLIGFVQHLDLAEHQPLARCESGRDMDRRLSSLFVALVNLEWLRGVGVYTTFGPDYLQLVRWLECDRIDQFGGATRRPFFELGMTLCDLA